MHAFFRDHHEDDPSWPVLTPVQCERLRRVPRTDLPRIAAQYAPGVVPAETIRALERERRSLHRVRGMFTNVPRRVLRELRAVMHRCKDHLR